MVFHLVLAVAVAVIVAGEMVLVVSLFAPGTRVNLDR
jgi:hypothetical protein